MSSATEPTGTCAGSPTGTLGNDICVQRTYSSAGQLLETIDAHGGVTKFWHDGNGQSKLIKDAAGNYTAANYNALGQRTHLFDPNMGNWTFTYNGLGEVVTQTDARNITVTTTYDRLGRVQSRTSSDGLVDTYVYDEDAIGTPINGLLGSESRNLSGGTVEYRRDYYFDQNLRPTGYQTELLHGSTLETYTIGIETDEYFARPKSITYPQINGQDVFRLYYKYDESGYVTEEGDSRFFDDPSEAPLRAISARDARDQITSEAYGNNLTNAYAYYPATGQMQQTTAGASGSLYLMQYEYDLFGNLEITFDVSRNVGEFYTYDRLHRIQSNTRYVNGSPQSPVTYSYDAIGNIESKSDFASSYSYNENAPVSCTGGGQVAAGPSAVTAAGTRQYSYDANGNLICSNAADGSLSAQYDAFNLPLSLNRNSQSIVFGYGSDNQRFYQQSGSTTTVYLDKLYERVRTAGQDEHKFYVGDYAIVEGDGSIRYLHRDRLNSILAITDENGAEPQATARRFDPFGRPQEEDMSAGDGLLKGTEETPRGFTQHEHLNSVALIHMNGRAYDYNLGRFLSVDPVIQFPANSQSLNPYSYLMNNPMAGTDPSGYESCGTPGPKGSSGLGCTPPPIDSTYAESPGDLGRRFRERRGDTSAADSAGQGYQEALTGFGISSNGMMSHFGSDLQPGQPFVPYDIGSVSLRPLEVHEGDQTNTIPINSYTLGDRRRGRGAYAFGAGIATLRAGASVTPRGTLGYAKVSRNVRFYDWAKHSRYVGNQHLSTIKMNPRLMVGPLGLLGVTIELASNSEGFIAGDPQARVNAIMAVAGIGVAPVPALFSVLLSPLAVPGAAHLVDALIGAQEHANYYRTYDADGDVQKAINDSIIDNNR